MRDHFSKVIAVIPGLAVLVGIVTGSDPAYIIFSILIIILIIIGNPATRLTSLTTWAMASPVMGPIYSLLAVAAATVAPITYNPRKVTSDTITKRLLLFPLIYSPMLIMNPSTVIPFWSYISAIAVDWFLSGKKLSKVKVTLPETDYTINYGDDAILQLLVETPGYSVYAALIVDGKVKEVVNVIGKKVWYVRVRSQRLGIERHDITIKLVDSRRRASAVRGPYKITIKTILKSLREIIKIKDSLPRSEWVPPAVIYKGIIRERKRSEKTGRGESEEGTGKARSTISLGLLEAPGYPLKPEILSVEAEPLAPEPLIHWVPITYTGKEYRGGKGLRGDYMGVREYASGDKPTWIHWKKSISRHELIVKVYEEGIESAQGGGDLLIVADWVARNPSELDELIRKTYISVIGGAGKRHLLIRMPNGTLYYTRGEANQLLSVLEYLIIRNIAYSRLNYSLTAKRDVGRDFHYMTLAQGFHRQLASYYLALAKAVVDSLKKLGLPNNTSFTMIYSDSTALRNYALSIVLSERYKFVQEYAKVSYLDVMEHVRAHIEHLKSTEY